ncbi:hypothetical protein CFAM422_005157 [Trichoderma lentiforme]|uniref:Uncharacterized protein n=1 Tax=Trichoderma lentiforme TaxID=1567552 RepID=A0A9P5CCB5_9HYPO|nr:hypothetical protein CFAM422_005157 [Trichoderma lentiforme]
MVVKTMLSAREFWALKFYPSSSFMGEFYKLEEKTQLALGASVFSTLEGNELMIGANGETIYPSKVDFAVSDQPIRERRNR